MSHVLILAAPRSGGGLLHDSLLISDACVKSSLSNRDFFSQIGSFEAIPDQIKDEIKASQDRNQITVDYLPFYSGEVEKLIDLFPEAKLIFAMRRPIDAMISAVQAWETEKFTHWDQPSGWWGTKWSFPHVSSAEELIGRPTPEIVAEQFLQLSHALSQARESAASTRTLSITFEDLVTNPQAVLEKVAALIGNDYNQSLPSPLPKSSRSLPKLPLARRQAIAGELAVALQFRSERLAPVSELWKKTLVDERLLEYKAPASQAPQTETKILPSTGTPFSSSFSDSFVQLLEKATASVAITTYKSGHLIIASASNGSINTTFRNFVRPMGLAVSGVKLAVGTKDAIESFSNQPSLSKAVEPKGFFQSVFAPRSVIFTGDIAIHEMAFGVQDNEEQLWFVNTSFSCLCRMDPNVSFAPVWRPKWISGLANEDRCHLNGLAMVNGEPKFVTALSQTDTAFGWRESKGTSGVIVDIETNRIVVDGLSMPHSPRWYQDQLWVLESGKGALCRIDLDSGQVDTIATLPGFTRGLAFIGKYALIGLSQVRETVFKNLPVTETKQERNAGVWIVDTTTGETVGMLKFDGVVSEVFDVSVILNSKTATVIGHSELTSFSYTLSPEAIGQLAKPSSDKP
jgi:uncharacterized protein (TIGR03032 family)